MIPAEVGHEDAATPSQAKEVEGSNMTAGKVMKPRFYHISVDDISYQPGDEIKLDHVRSADPQSKSVVDQIKSIFPDGLSIWGIKMVNPSSWIVGEPDTEHSLMLKREADFEEIRRQHFKDKPSRLQSLFAFQSIEDVSHFISVRRLQDRNIWLIEGNDYFIGDVTVYEGLKFGQFKEAANLYWSGVKTDRSLLEVVMKLPVRIVSKLETV